MPATPWRSTIRSRPRASPPKRSSSGATPASTTSCRACSRAAPSRCWRSAGRANDEPFNSEDLALLTAVAGQVATAIENGRLYRQLHLKAEELGRMREFNENILESLDDGLVVFDLEERIVRWNRALEGFYGIDREDAIGRTLGEVFDQPFVQALAAARRENPYGATLYRVPLTARQRPRPERRRRAAARHGDGRAAAGSGQRRRGRRHSADRRHHRSRAARRAAADFREDGVDRPAGRRRGARSQHAVDRHLELHADAARRRRSRPIRGRCCSKRSSGRPSARPRSSTACSICRARGRTNEPASVDLNAVITDVFALLEHQFEVGSIKIRRELAESPVPVVGIEHQLQQVFLNLFLNARDAMPSGGWLLVSTRIEDDRVDRRNRGHRFRHSGGASRAHLRPVLHDEGDRAGHGPRVVHLVRHRARARRRDSLRQRRRPGDTLHAVAAARRRSRARERARV